MTCITHLRFVAQGFQHSKLETLVAESISLYPDQTRSRTAYEMSHVVTCTFTLVLPIKTNPAPCSVQSASHSSPCHNGRVGSLLVGELYSGV